MSRVAALWDRAARGSALAVRDTEVAARSLGIALQSVAVRPDPRDLRCRIRGHEARRRRGGHRDAELGFFASYQRIADLALTHRLPSAGGSKEYAVAGGLISYGADLPGSLPARRRSSWTRSSRAPSRLTCPSSSPRSSSWSSISRRAKALGLDDPADAAAAGESGHPVACADQRGPAPRLPALAALPPASRGVHAAASMGSRALRLSDVIGVSDVSSPVDTGDME